MCKMSGQNGLIQGAESCSIFVIPTFAMTGALAWQVTIS
ncbi:hypothetical protein SLEP1_g8014 [Rubroshorea leprosula]|uniref:Uncharacterized protein n=1 Tax=Rubroshorea leprosula TaxID=152421 RepID=A0AAV5I6A0_9ROSI|nr:hypothetical protein SLEP1_g8014 [Rubroshorea leprosula]